MRGARGGDDRSRGGFRSGRSSRGSVWVRALIRSSATPPSSISHRTVVANCSTRDSPQRSRPDTVIDDE